MTKKQSQVALKIKRDEAAGMARLNNILVFRNQHTNSITDKWHAEVSNRPVKKQEHKKVVKRKPAVILLEKFSSTNRSDWREQLQAGCKIWVNHTSGEVSTVCPWNSTKDDEEILKGTIPHSENIGTGSIVYDGAEFGEFMTALDRLSVKRTLTSPK
jgi:hypothetical protein